MAVTLNQVRSGPLTWAYRRGCVLSAASRRPLPDPCVFWPSSRGLALLRRNSTVRPVRRVTFEGACLSGVSGGWAVVGCGAVRGCVGRGAARLGWGCGGGRARGGGGGGGGSLVGRPGGAGRGRRGGWGRCGGPPHALSARCQHQPGAKQA